MFVVGPPVARKSAPLVVFPTSIFMHILEFVLGERLIETAKFERKEFPALQKVFALTRGGFLFVQMVAKRKHIC